MTAALLGAAGDARLRLVHEALLLPQRARILRRIADAGRMSANRIAAAEGFSNPAAHAHLGILRAAGLIDRSWQSGDWRSLPVHITPFGRHCLWFAEQVIR